MAKHGFRVMDSDLHVIEPRTLWQDYFDPGFRGRITLAADGEGQMRAQVDGKILPPYVDRKSTRLNSSHPSISYAVFCLKKKKKNKKNDIQYKRQQQQRVTDIRYI